MKRTIIIVAAVLIALSAVTYGAIRTIRAVPVPRPVSTRSRGSRRKHETRRFPADAVFGAEAFEALRGPAQRGVVEGAVVPVREIAPPRLLFRQPRFDLRLRRPRRHIGWIPLFQLCDPVGAPDPVHALRRAVGLSVGRITGDMGRGEVGERQELPVDLGLVLPHVEHRPGDLPTGERRLQRRGIDNFAARGVEKESRRLQGGQQIGIGKVGVVPIPAIILIVVFLITHFVMTYTTTGRSVYAIGGNTESARLSGIKVFKTKVIVFSAVQVMCVLAAFMHSAQVASGSYSFGKGWEVDVISSVVIGGTSMAGGIGKPWGTLMGILFMGVVINAMTILNVDIYAQYVVRGAIMAFAVLMATLQSKAKA